MVCRNDWCSRGERLDRNGWQRLEQRGQHEHVSHGRIAGHLVIGDETREGDLLADSKDGGALRIPSIAREVYDVSGAGDTVTAWLGTALAAGASVREAAQLANYAAGVEVGKPGVATVSPEEVLAVHEERFDQLGRLRRGGVI